MTGVIVLACAVLATGAAAWVLSIKNGRFAAKPNAERLAGADIGVELGGRATLVQFSSAFCAPCRATRVLLNDIADKTPGVVTVDIDAEEHLNLVRRLNIMRTPTVLVLDSRGGVVTKASGLPRREQVLAALSRATM